MTLPLRRTFVILSVAAAAMAVLLAFLPAAGHDQLWLLYVARHVLAGERLYGPTLLESNPPLIIGLSLLPAWLAVHLHLDAAAVGKVLVLALEAGIAIFGLRILRRSLALTPTQTSALVFVFIVVFNVVPARDLGQRDYLLALLVLPYLLETGSLLGGAASNGAEQVLIAVLATVGFALKPHQALVPVALETALLLHRRSPRTLLRPAPICFLFGGFSYLVLIRHFTPEYLTEVLPLLRETYWAFGHRTVPQLVLDAIELHILLALVLWLFLRSRPRSPLVTTFILASLASTAAYFLQGTGWYYQQLPALSFASFALLLLLFPKIGQEDHRLSSWLPRAATVLSFLAVCLTTHFMGYPFTRERSFPIDQPDPRLFAGLSPGTPVATITTTVDDVVMPAEKFHLTIAQRYPHLWMLPAILRNEAGTAPSGHRLSPEQLTRLEATQHRFFLEDLQRFRPVLILVNRCQDSDVHCQVLEDRHDDLLAWFAHDPATLAFLSQYHFAGSFGAYSAYRL